MDQREKFKQAFKNLAYVIKRSERILLVAHSRPDSDTVGAVLAFQDYLKENQKEVTLVCFDPFPEYLGEIAREKFYHPDDLNLQAYDTVIACDSMERGFQKILPILSEKQLSVLIDHHPHIELQGDITIIDSEYSSACEIVYDFFVMANLKITQKMATFLLLGILGDTGIFQHSNTTARVMEISAELVKKGANLTKVIEVAFSNKKISTLKLWGRAFERAKINPQNGMIATVLTREDLHECGATEDDIAQVASILNAVPGTRFSLILSERDGGIVKGSLRSEEYKGVDVSSIARQFGGGGHKLASGFEVKGKISAEADGWKII